MIAPAPIVRDGAGARERSAEVPVELSGDEVRQIARLARLALTGEEAERLRVELSGILGHCRAIGEVDTAGVEPTAWSFALANAERPDEPRPSEDREAVLANAPRREDGYIRVRAVLG